MKRINRKTIKMMVGVVASLLVSGALSSSVQAFDYPVPGDFALGAQQWADSCTRCHNLRGPAELRDDQWITTMFHMRLRAGLTGEETRNILTFIQASNNSLPGGSPTKASLIDANGTNAQSGKAIYDQTCIACHGANGKGAIPGVPDLTDSNGRLSQPDDVLLINVVRGLQSSGSPMAMPPKGGNPELSEADIRAVIEYLHSSFGP